MGTELDGVVRSVTSFGAFVDIGYRKQGLVHISQLRVRMPLVAAVTRDSLLGERVR